MGQGNYLLFSCHLLCFQPFCVQFLSSLFFKSILYLIYLFFFQFVFFALYDVSVTFLVWSVSLPLEVPVTVACISHSPPPTHSRRLASGREALWRWGTMCGLALSCTLQLRSERTTCPSWLWRRRRLSSWRTWTRSAGPAWETPCRAANSSNSGENLKTFFGLKHLIYFYCVNLGWIL